MFTLSNEVQWFDKNPPQRYKMLIGLFVKLLKQQEIFALQISAALRLRTSIGIKWYIYYGVPFKQVCSQLYPTWFTGPFGLINLVPWSPSKYRGKGYSWNFCKHVPRITDTYLFVVDMCYYFLPITYSIFDENTQKHVLICEKNNWIKLPKCQARESFKLKHTEGNTIFYSSHCYN